MLSVQKYKNALVYPDNYLKPWEAFGVNVNSNFLNGSRLTRGKIDLIPEEVKELKQYSYKEIVQDPKLFERFIEYKSGFSRPCSPKKKLHGEYIWGGYFFTHFGHFLTESLARLWYIQQNPDLPILWTRFWSKFEMKPHNEEILKLLNVKNEIILINEVIEVETLRLPDPGAVLPYFYEPEYIQSLGVLPAIPTQKGKKVWLSRSRLSATNIINEAFIENYLAAKGWMIIHPEECSVQYTVNHINSAEIVAGPDGSAFHVL